MHESVMRWVKSQVDRLWPDGDLSGVEVLEIGSCDVNGSVRTLFANADYTGIDRDEGPGVDRQVIPGEPLPFDDDSFSVVVSTEMLEHDERPWRSVAEWHRVLTHNGTLLATARGFDAERGCFGYHDPPDYWRYSAGAMRMLAFDAGFPMTNIVVYQDPQAQGFFLSAVKA
jgi:SAM-dependent methyltransferase